MEQYYYFVLLSSALLFYLTLNINDCRFVSISPSIGTVIRPLGSDLGPVPHCRCTELPVDGGSSCNGGNRCAHPRFHDSGPYQPITPRADTSTSALRTRGSQYPCHQGRPSVFRRRGQYLGSNLAGLPTAALGTAPAVDT